MSNEKELFLDETEETVEDVQIDEYDLTSTPNDFNILTIINFIESGAIKIPGFQRNYVWDVKRASKLIESLILGLPVPQIFLYEENRNEFLVIDGQQRLMSIYYFVKQRIPRKDKRTAIRSVMAREGVIPEEIMHNDELFQTFKLRLPANIDSKNKFNGLTYKSLGQYKMQFDLRPIRNVIVKQNVPKDDNSSVYEIFNRLNSGGINLRPQEIRSSLYHSAFYEMLDRINLNPTWRQFLRMEDPALHLKDIEILLRAFAIGVDGDSYSSSLAKFLNTFSEKAKSFSDDRIKFYESFFVKLMEEIKGFPSDTFINESNGRFNAFLFEALFYATSREPFLERNLNLPKLTVELIESLKVDDEFESTTIAGTTNKANVTNRLSAANRIINGITKE